MKDCGLSWALSLSGLFALREASGHIVGCPMEVPWKETDVSGQQVSEGLEAYQQPRE